MATLEKKVTSLEEQLEAMKRSAPCLTDPVAGDSQNCPAIFQNRSDINTIKFFISEKKERSKRHLNLIIHNVPESAVAEGPARKQHDIEYLTSGGCGFLKNI